jgi:hypothetical protein
VRIVVDRRRERGSGERVGRGRWPERGKRGRGVGRDEKGVGERGWRGEREGGRDHRIVKIAKERGRNERRSHGETALCC